MEEQTTWKGHSFTLLVFTGIVVLCSIFFILGMLVGRGQGQKIAVAAAAGLDAKTALRPDTQDQTQELPVYESPAGNEKPPALEALAVKPEPPAPEPSTRVKTAPAPAPPANLVNYQISAMRKSPEAEKLLDDLKKKGFRAFILAPSAGDPNPFFRVQVGPFGNMLEAEQAKKKLESAGYRPILKK